MGQRPPRGPGAVAAGAAAVPAAGVGAFLSTAFWPVWPRNKRVGANSPSLWPTMFSVTYTGMNLLPLCTAKVWPTNSGSTVEARDQVLITRFSLRAFSASTRLVSATCTNGPFLTLLPIGELDERVYCVALPRLRPRTIRRCDGFFLLRVLTPSFLPHGLTTFRPPRVRPPCGWSTGFMTSPRTFGRRPFQRVLPALPHDTSSCSSFPTVPIVA